MKNKKELIKDNFANLDNLRSQLEFKNDKKEAKPTNVSASDITEKYYHKIKDLSTHKKHV